MKAKDDGEASEEEQEKESTEYSLFWLCKESHITLVDITDSKNTFTRNCGLKNFMWKVDQLNNIPYFSMTDRYLACYINAGFWYASFYRMMTKFFVLYFCLTRFEVCAANEASIFELYLRWFDDTRTI